MLSKLFYNNGRTVQTKRGWWRLSSLSPCVKLSAGLCVTAVKCQMKTPPGAETRRAVPPGCWNKMSQHQKKKNIAGLKRGTTRFMLVWFGLFYALVDLGGFLFELKGFHCQTDVCLFLRDTSFGSVAVDLFIGSLPRVDELFLDFVVSALTPSVSAVFTDMFVLDFC